MEQAKASITAQEAIEYIGYTDINVFLKDCLELDQRKGQLFFNKLDRFDQTRLNGTLLDPFYKNSFEAICKALEFLLS